MHSQDIKPEDTNDPYVILRVYVSEADRVERGTHHGKPLWEAIFNDFKARGLAGATVIRAIAGYGVADKRHNMLSEYLAFDLPIVIEVVDEESAIRAILPDLDAMIGGGLVTIEKVEVVIYRKEGKG